jgi:membrane dipeptidase
MEHPKAPKQAEELEPLLTAETSVPRPSYESSYFRCATVIIWSTLITLFFACLALVVIFSTRNRLDNLPKDALAAAEKILGSFPVIDGHIGDKRTISVVFQLLINRNSTDLPYLVRYLYANNITAVDLSQTVPGHVDIPRLRKGKSGGFFW